MEKRKGSDFSSERQSDYFAQEDQEQISQGLGSFCSESLFDLSEANDCKDLFNLGESGGSSDKNYGKSDTSSERKRRCQLMRQIYQKIYFNYCGFWGNRCNKDEKQVIIIFESQQKLRTEIRGDIEEMNEKRVKVENPPSMDTNTSQYLELKRDFWANFVMNFVVPKKSTPNSSEKLSLAYFDQKSIHNSWLHFLIAFYHEVSDYSETRNKVWEEILETVKFFRLSVFQSKDEHISAATNNLIIRDISKTVKMLREATLKNIPCFFGENFTQLLKRPPSKFSFEPCPEDERCCENSPPRIDSPQPTRPQKDRTPQELDIEIDKFNNLKTERKLADLIVTCVTKPFNLGKAILKPTYGADIHNVKWLVHPNYLKGQENIVGLLVVRKHALEKKNPLTRMETYIGLKEFYNIMLACVPQTDSPEYEDLKFCCNLFDIDFQIA